MRCENLRKKDAILLDNNTLYRNELKDYVCKEKTESTHETITESHFLTYTVNSSRVQASWKIWEFLLYN